MRLRSREKYLISAHYRMCHYPTVKNFIRLSTLVKPEHNRGARNPDGFGNNCHLFTDYFYLALVYRGHNSSQAKNYKKSGLFMFLNWDKSPVHQKILNMVLRSGKFFITKLKSGAFAGLYVVSNESHNHQKLVQYLTSFENTIDIEKTKTRDQKLGSLLGYPQKDIDFFKCNKSSWIY